MTGPRGRTSRLQLGRLEIEESSLEVFRRLFVTRESRAAGDIAEAQKDYFWPVREPTAFELFFIVENQRGPGQEAAEAWAKRLNVEGKSCLAEFIASGAMTEL